MSNNVLLEVSRVHEIMGITPKLLLNEQWKWLAELASKSPKIFEQFDSMLKQARRGINFSDSQIDNIVDSIKSFGKLTDDEAKQLKNLLKNDTKLRELLNTTDNFLEDLKKLYPDGAPPAELYALTKTAGLTVKEVTEIVTSTVAKIVKKVGSKANKLLTAFEDKYVELLDALYKNGEYLNNIDEVYDIMDGKLNEVLKTNVASGKISSDVAEKLYNEVSGAFRQSEKIKSKITEIEAAGRNLGGPKRTTTVKFNDAKIDKSFSDVRALNADGTVKVDVGLVPPITRKKATGLFDETGKPIEKLEQLPDDITKKYDKLKTKLESELTPTEKSFIGEVDKWKNGEDVIDDVNAMSKKLDEELNIKGDVDPGDLGEPMLDEFGELTPKWTDMFFKRIFQGPLGETIVNIIRGMFRKPEEFIRDSKLTLNAIAKKFEEMRFVSPTDAPYKKLKSELDALTARLKSDMMLSQTPNQMFATQWTRIQTALKDALPYYEATQLINMMGKSGNAKVSIDTFLAWTLKNAESVSLKDVLKQYNTFGEYLASTQAGQWAAQYKTLWAKESGYLNKFWAVGKQALGDILATLFLRIPQLLTLGVFRFRGEIIKLLKGTGRLTGLQGLKRIFLTYIQITIVSNLIHPFIDLVWNSILSGLEDIPGAEVIKLEFGTAKKQFLQDLKQRIPLYGNDFSWNPFYNPVPAGVLPQAVNDGVLWLGFEPAPLPNDLYDLAEFLINKDTTPDQMDVLEKKLQDELNQKITNLYKEMSPEEKEKFKNGTHYNNLKVINLNNEDNLKFYGLTSQEGATLSKHMYFKLQAVQATKDEDIKVEGFVPNIKNMMGQTWVCSVNPINEGGVDVCNGDSWRVLIYNDNGVENDSNFKKYEMDSNNVMARKYVYVVNKSVENDAKPNVGYKNDNLRPIKELLPKLKDIDVPTPKEVKNDNKNDNKNQGTEFMDVVKRFYAESRYKKTNNMITERNKEKFGEDNFKHWKDTFTFKAQDEKNPGQYKEVKIKMEDVMDRINHYRKKYDEDDSFVRAVIDTHEDVVKIMFTKDLANIHESATPRGLALVLRTIKESRGEMEIFSVARPANGNWFLVKGDYTPNQLANMDLEKKEPRTKETEVNSKSEDDLKKKEESAINVLKRNEKEGIEDLPKKIRDKVREKMGKGWTTETPPEELKEYFTTSEINSIFNDKIVIYKLEPTKEFFNNLVKFSARIVIKRGFCRTLKSGKNEIELGERQKMTVNHILNKCNTKYESKLGLRNF